VKLSKQDRERIRMKFGGYCAYCGGGPNHIPLPEKGWHVAPIYRESRIDRDRYAQGEFRLVQTGSCE